MQRRIGLVNTMVFTHIPSSVLLLTVPFMPTFPVAAALFLLREALVEMDVPTRQSYVMAVVRPKSAPLPPGITHLVRLAGWAVAPAIAGLLMTGTSLAAPLVVGAALKILYDIVLVAGLPEAPSARRIRLIILMDNPKCRLPLCRAMNSELARQPNPVEQARNLLRVIFKHEQARDPRGTRHRLPRAHARAPAQHREIGDRIDAGPRECVQAPAGFRGNAGAHERTPVHRRRTRTRVTRSTR